MAHQAKIWWFSVCLITVVLISDVLTYRAEKKDDSFAKLKKLLSPGELKTLIHILETDVDIDADSYGIDKDDLWGVEESDISDKDDYDLLEALDSLKDDDYYDEYSNYDSNYDYDFDDYDYEDDIDDYSPNYDEYLDDDYLPEYRSGPEMGQRKFARYGGIDSREKHHRPEDYERGYESDYRGDSNNRDKYSGVNLSKNGLGIKRKMGYQKLSPIPELNLEDLSKFKEKENLYFPNGYSSNAKSKSSGGKRPEYYNPTLENHSSSNTKTSGGYFSKIASSLSSKSSSKDSDRYLNYESIITGKRGSTDYGLKKSKDRGYYGHSSEDYGLSSYSGELKSDDYGYKSPNNKRSDDYDSKSSDEYGSKSNVKRSDEYGSKSNVKRSDEYGSKSNVKRSDEYGSKSNVKRSDEYGSKSTESKSNAKRSDEYGSKSSSSADRKSGDKNAAKSSDDKDTSRKRKVNSDEDYKSLRNHEERHGHDRRMKRKRGHRGPPHRRHRRRRHRRISRSRRDDEPDFRKHDTSDRKQSKGHHDDGKEKN